jgi:hypothetical protein
MQPVPGEFVRGNGEALVCRVRNPLSTEGVDASGWQGAKSENIGNI